MSTVSLGGSVGVSVILCTHNGAARLRPTLEALARCAADFPVTVIVVDNNSTDGTTEAAARIWRETGNTAFDFRVIAEMRRGLAFARRAGIAAARSDILVFCDDDNWLAPDYLAVARAIMLADPEIGVLGGQAAPHFESPPPAWFLDNQESFALGTQADAEGDVTETRGWVWGAGFVLRAAALLQLDGAGVSPVASDRMGGKMTTGGDVELCLYLRELGWRIWYSPRLKLTHFMPASRFERRKFCALTVQNGVLYATVQYPIYLCRGRLGAALGTIRSYARGLLGNPRAFRTRWESLYLLGKLLGFATGGKRFATVRENRRTLRRFRAARQPAAPDQGETSDAGALPSA